MCFHLLLYFQDENCHETVLELKQTVSLVYDLIILGQESRDWSFRKLFGVGLAGPCPLAKSSKIYVDCSTNGVGRPVKKYYLFVLLKIFSCVLLIFSDHI